MAVGRQRHAHLVSALAAIGIAAGLLPSASLGVTAAAAAGGNPRLTPTYPAPTPVHGSATRPAPPLATYPEDPAELPPPVPQSGPQCVTSTVPDVLLPQGAPPPLAAPHQVCAAPARSRGPEADQVFPHASALPASSPSSSTAQLTAIAAPQSATLMSAPGSFPSPDWVKQSPSTSPSGREELQMVYDAAHNQTIVVSGLQQNGTEPLDMYMWTGTTWQRQTPPTLPAARHLGAIAYDPVRQNVVIFGGYYAGNYHNDTWTWNGSTWTQKSPASVPSARGYMSMAFDPAINKVVLFGGTGYVNGQLTNLGDTWAWDGATWSQLAPAASPSPRDMYGLALDKSSNNLVLFGGEAQQTLYGDTWLFNGTTWVQQSPASPPSTRNKVGMAYDDDLQGVVLFGGCTGPTWSGCTETNETWLWRSGTWARASGIAAPSGRDDFGIAFNPTNHQMVVFGGDLGGGSRTNETWTYNVQVPTAYKAADRTGQGGYPPIYPRGAPVTYTVTIGNAGPTDLTNVTLNDSFSELDSGGSPISINGVACAAPLVCTSGNGISVQHLTVPAGSTSTVVYSLVGEGLTKRCSTGNNQVTATSSAGTSPTSSVTVVICDAGLGLENWWTYVKRDVGPMGVASVNVANGNLVVQQTDSTPVQGHGRIGLVLRRTYNSMDTALAQLPGSFGAGWMLNIGQSDSLAGDGITATSLYVPTPESVVAPLAVTYVDQDGTRHVFKFKGLTGAAAINVLPAPSPLPSVTGALMPSSILQAWFTAQTPQRYNYVCVDQTYEEPSGVHLGLWRYIALHSGNGSAPCANPDNSTSPVVLGFAAVRPDRVRYEFSWDGHLLDMRDASGNELQYTYGGLLPNNPLTAIVPAPGVALGYLLSVVEPSSGRQFTLSYNNAGNPTTPEIDVTDPAQRLTKYLFDTPLTDPLSLRSVHLVSVVNPNDGGILQYRYGSQCSGSNAGVNQLCSAGDPVGNATTFSYCQNTAAFGATPTTCTTPSGSTGCASPTYGPGDLLALTDRRHQSAFTTSFCRHDSPNYTTVDQSGHRSSYQLIDIYGRVGRIDEGDYASPMAMVRQTFQTWDGNADPQLGGSAVYCRQPDAVLDKNLCRLVRKSLMTGQADEDTSFQYSPEGQPLVQSKATAPTNVVTTSAYHTQYFEGTGTVRTYDDTINGGGTVTAGGPRSGREDGATLFAITDRTKSLTPRGNAAGSGFAAYLTTLYPDDNTAVSPNTVPSPPVCASPRSPSSNTGLLCEKDEPAFDASGAATVTRYTYDGFGQRATMTTPKTVAEARSTSDCSGTNAPASTPVTKYTYYQHGDRDLSGTTPADGWLRAVTDPCGAFVASGYDAAGNVARSWDRAATAAVNGATETTFPGSLSAPPSSAYVETLHACPGGPVVCNGNAGSYGTQVWRYLLDKRDQVGDITSLQVDANGNQTVVTPPRGNPQSGHVTTYDVSQAYDQTDKLVCRLMPAEANGGQCSASSRPTGSTTMTYGAFGNATAVQDPLGNVVVSQYDTANRTVAVKWTRGPWPGDGSQPPACAQSQSADAPIPAGRILCSTVTSYDGQDDVTASWDGNHQQTTHAFDGVHRQVQQQVPRNDNGLTTLVTRTNYDADGHSVDTCTPRQYTEGGTAPSAGCPSGAPYTQHMTYDLMGRQSSTTTYRIEDGQSTPTAHLSATGYDADGNPVRVADPNAGATVDANGNLVRAAAVDAHTTLDVVDLRGFKFTETVPRDATHRNTTTWTHNASGDVTATSRPADGGGQRITASSFDSAHRQVDTVQGADSVDASVFGTVDGTRNDRSRTVYDADSHVVAEYDPRAFAAGSTPDGHFMVRTDYDVDGRPIAHDVPRYGTGASDPGYSTNGFNYQTGDCASGNPAYPSDVGVCITRVSYDAASNRTQVTLPTSVRTNNQYFGFAYTDDHLVQNVTGPSPVQSSPTTAAPRITTMSYLYDADGQAVKTTDALGLQTTTSYTADEKVKVQVGHQVYWSNGAVKIPHQTTATYDANGAPTASTVAVCAAVPSPPPDTNPPPPPPCTPDQGSQYHSQTSTMSYYSDGQKHDVVDAASDDTHYAYDADNNPTTVFSPAAWSSHQGSSDPTNTAGTPATAAFSFDNLLTSATEPVHPDGTQLRETDYSYDAGSRKTGQHVFLTDGNRVPLAGQDGGTQSSSYAANDRLTQETGRDQATIQTQYDPAGNRTQVVNGSSTVTTSYYLDDRPLQVNDGNRMVRYAYDGLGSRSARTDNTEQGVQLYSTTYDWGDAELPLSMSSTVANGGTTSWGYDAAARPATEAMPNGNTVGFTVNSDDTLQAKVQSPSGGGTPIASWCFTYDGLQRQVTQTHTANTAACSAGQGGAQTNAFTYDPANRVASASVGTGAAQPVRWDHNGNRTDWVDQTQSTSISHHFDYNADNSIADDKATPQGGPTTTFTLSYLPFGGLCSDQTRYYQYDGFDRLTTISPTSSSTCPQTPGSPSVSYAYDGLDRQTSHTENGKTTALFYDGLSTSVATESVNSVDTAYALDANGGRKALQTLGGTPTLQFLTDDGHGNIAAVSGSSTQPTLVCDVAYDPFGVPLTAQANTPCSSSTTANDHYYHGGRQDQTTGQYQFGARTYDPTKGVFIEPDSYRNAQPAANLSVGTDPLTQNRYSYVNGDPVNLVDPNGHNPCSYEGTGPGGCTQDENRALAASDRGADTSGSWAPAPSGRQRTYHAPASFGSRPRSCGSLCALDYSATHPQPGVSWDELQAQLRQAELEQAQNSQGGQPSSDLPSPPPGVPADPTNQDPGHGKQCLQEFGSGKGLDAECLQAKRVAQSHAGSLLAGQLNLDFLALSVLVPQADALEAAGVGAAERSGGLGPVLQGQAGVGRSIAAAEARGETVLGREITIDTTGARTRLDLLVQDAEAQLKLIEAKSGPFAGLTPNQRIAFPLLESEGGIPRGLNAARGGLEPGVPIGPLPVQIDWWSP